MTDRLSPGELPTELLQLVAHQLVPPLTHSKPFEVAHDTASAAKSPISPGSFAALITLSSLSAALRRLLCPLIWQEILIHRPDRLGKLRSIMEYYQRLASSASEIDRFIYPLPLVRCLKVIMPDRYLSLDQEILRHLFRSGMNPANGLHTLEWDAEVLPSPMIWRMLGTPEKPPELEAMLAERKGRTMSREQIREIALDADANTGPMFHPRLGTHPPEQGHDLDTSLERLRLSSTEGVGSSPPKQESSYPQERIETTIDRPRGLESLSLHCRIFYSGSIDMSRLRCLRHLRLTSYDAHLLPPHLPSLLLSLYTPLSSISLSTSKTTLLHDVDLIERGLFDELVDLDVFAVTPEYPLWLGLRRAGRKLKRLRLILDINSSFRNFDRLFRELAEGGAEDSTHGRQEDFTIVHEAASSSPSRGAFPELVSLFVEPLPQENTASSFPRFLDTCPKLRFLNGRRVDGLGRTGSAELFSFDPDQRSGAFFY